MCGKKTLVPQSGQTLLLQLAEAVTKSAESCLARRLLKGFLADSLYLSRVQIRVDSRILARWTANMRLVGMEDDDE